MAIGGGHIRRGSCLSGNANSRVYGGRGSSISVILVWGFRHIQLKADTLHLLDAGHILCRHGCPRNVKPTDQTPDTLKCTPIDFGKAHVKISQGTLNTPRPPPLPHPLSRD